MSAPDRIDALERVRDAADAYLFAVGVFLENCLGDTVDDADSRSLLDACVSARRALVVAVEGCPAGAA